MGLSAPPSAAKQAVLPIARSPRSERGGTLLLAIGILALTGIILSALIGFAQTYVHDGNAFQARTDRIQRHGDAVQYAFNAVRNNNAVGQAGGTSTWTYSGVSVSCTGDAGSGVASGSGRTDRTVTCQTSEIQAQMRFFDRGGSASGVVSELLSWKLLRS